MIGMKITFIYPDIIGSASYQGSFYLGIGILSASLKQNGFETSLIHITKAIDKDAFLKKVKKEHAQLYAFSSTTLMFDFARKWSGWIKESAVDTPVLLGGVHPTLYPQEALDSSKADFVCVGEGEGALVDLCRQLDSGGRVDSIANIWGKARGRIFKNNPRRLVTDLDQLPFADRTIFKYSCLTESREGTAFFMASRGCPYNCPYCCNHKLRLVYPNKDSWVRFRSVNNLIGEIKEVKAKNPLIKSVAFYDDILALRKDWFREFTKAYRQQINLPFRCNMRVELLAEEENLKMLKSAGCYRVIVGLESGNEQLRKKVLKRKMSNNIFVKAGVLCKKYGIELATYNMLGLPGEKPVDLLDTLKLNAQALTDFNYASIFYPFAGTELYELCRSQNMLTESKVTDYVEGTVLNFSRLNKQRILFVRNYFKGLVSFYKTAYRLKPAIGRLAIKIFEKTVFSRIGCWVLCPLANLIFKSARENKFLSKINALLKSYKQRRKALYIRNSF